MIKRWDGNHIDFTLSKKESTIKYIGTKANNDICKYQLKGIKKKFSSHINKITFKKKFWEIILNNKRKYIIFPLFYENAINNYNLVRGTRVVLQQVVCQVLDRIWWSFFD